MRPGIGAILLSCLVSAIGQTQRPTQSPASPAHQSNAGSATETGTSTHKEGWVYDADAGIVFRRGDFKWISWGYGEHVFRTRGEGFWRRARQGMEFDLPRFALRYRDAIVYEVDFTDTNFFRDRSKLNIVENLYWAVQDAEDPGKARVLFGENTHILSREDNLSSGNLPTINRSLVLEEHGSLHSFGTQFGLELYKSVSPRYSISSSVLDNRGSLNTSNPHYVVGNSLAVKFTGRLLNSEQRGRKLSIGLGIDHTRDIRQGTWTFISAVAGKATGSAPAAGNKLSLESEIVYTDRLRNRPFTIEAESILSDFSKTRTVLEGGYSMAQYSCFNSQSWGDLDPFVRYDWVHLSTPGISASIAQQALRTGINWNLPKAHKLANFHIEYARNMIVGPKSAVSAGQQKNELGLELRFSLTRYIRQ